MDVMHTLCMIVQHYDKDFGKLNVALKQYIKHKIIFKKRYRLDSREGKLSR